MAPTPISLEANTVFRATWSGTLPQNEIFAHHQMFYTSEAYTLDEVATNLSTHITNLLSTSVFGVNTMSGIFASTTQWTRLTLQNFDAAAGVAVGDPHYTALSDAGTGDPALPNQIAHCVTIKADPFGRRNMNRFYLPPYASGAGAQDAGVVESDVCDAVSAWLHNQQATLIDTEPLLSMCVYSPTDHAVYKPIETYVGNYLDTIRRRRNKVREVRHIATLAQLSGT